MDAALETRLKELVDVLLTANRQFNLTGIKIPEEAWVKHILDSLQGLETGLFDGEKSFVDIGAGAGFPGLPLALAQPGLRPTFLEATGKKCNFIRETAAHFGLKAKVVNERAEVVGHKSGHRASYDLATVRALGSVMEVAEYALPLVRVGGHVVLWRGKDAVAEAQDAELALDILGGALYDVQPYQLPELAMTYHLVILQKMGATPRTFPRSVGLPKAKPLTG